MESFISHVIRERGPFEMHVFDRWGGEERGGDVDRCKYTRIKSTFNRFKNKNQRLTELTEFAIQSLIL